MTDGMLSIESLEKSYASRGGDSVPAVKGVSLEVAAGELFTLLGPSGCGKTTTLRSIAGLEDPDGGKVVVAGRTLFSSVERINLPPHRRELGMVFQSYAVWPHMSVFDNVAFPLRVLARRQRPPSSEIAQSVGKALAAVRLDSLAGRPATDLSGGQQQRLALARALVMEPRLLLLDEPLSNLDAKLREEMRFELKRMQRELGITTVYVTHDQVEALSMSNRIAVMNSGCIDQIDHPRSIYEKPATAFVAEFIGSTNLLEGTLRESSGDDRWLVETSAGRLVVTSPEPVEQRDRVRVMIRPEHLTVSELSADDAGSPQHGLWIGEVVARAFQGDSVEHRVRIGDLVLRTRGHPSVSIPDGRRVSVTVDEQYCSVVT